MSTPSSSAVRALALEYKSLQEEPVEGFRVKLLNDDNLFEWEVAIFGPPDTLYQGGYFKVSMHNFVQKKWIRAFERQIDNSSLSIAYTQTVLDAKKLFCLLFECVSLCVWMSEFCFSPCLLLACLCVCVVFIRHVSSSER